MPFVNVPSTESADYINAQKSEFEDTYYVDNLNTLGAGGGGGGNKISAYYWPYSLSYAFVSVTPGYTSNLVNTANSWQVDFDDIGLDHTSPGVASAGAFGNSTGASLDLYVEAAVRTFSANGLWQFIPQTSSDNGVSWTNAFAPGTTRQYYTGVTDATVPVAALVTVPDTHWVRLAAYNGDAYSADFAMQSCKITQK